MDDNVHEFPKVVDIDTGQPSERGLGKMPAWAIRDLEGLLSMAKDGRLTSYGFVAFFGNPNDGFVRRSHNVVVNGNYYTLLGGVEALKQRVLQGMEASQVTGPDEPPDCA